MQCLGERATSALLTTALKTFQKQFDSTSARINIALSPSLVPVSTIVIVIVVVVFVVLGALIAFWCHKHRSKRSHNAQREIRAAYYGNESD